MIRLVIGTLFERRGLNWGLGCAFFLSLGWARWMDEWMVGWDGWQSCLEVERGAI